MKRRRNKNRNEERRGKQKKEKFEFFSGKRDGIRSFSMEKERMEKMKKEEE